MIRIDADFYKVLGQKYGLPSQKCGMWTHRVRAPCRSLKNELEFLYHRSND